MYPGEQRELGDMVELELSNEWQSDLNNMLVHGETKVVKLARARVI